jgi:hypothetical protein
MQTQEAQKSGKADEHKLQKRLDHLKTLRQEIRVKIDLAEADVREAFLKIEPAVDNAEHEVTHMAQGAAGAVAKAAAMTLDALAKSLREIRARMPK